MGEGPMKNMGLKMKKKIAILLAAVLTVGSMNISAAAPVLSGCDDVTGDYKCDPEEDIDSSGELDTPANVGWKEGALATARWDEVESADYYEVRINIYSGLELIGQNETGTAATEVDLQQEIRSQVSDGIDSVNVEFCVAARNLESGAAGEFSAYSPLKEYAINALESIDAPEEVTLSDNCVLSFKVVEKANHYTIYHSIEGSNTAGSIDTIGRGEEKDGYFYIDMSDVFFHEYQAYGIYGKRVKYYVWVEAISAEGRSSEESERSNSIEYYYESPIPTPEFVSFKIEDGRVIYVFRDDSNADDYEFGMRYKNFIDDFEGSERNPEAEIGLRVARAREFGFEAVKNDDGCYEFDITPMIRYLLLYPGDLIRAYQPFDVLISMRSIKNDEYSVCTEEAILKDHVVGADFDAPNNASILETDDDRYYLSFDRVEGACRYEAGIYMMTENGRAAEGTVFSDEDVSWNGDTGTVEITDGIVGLYQEIFSTKLCYSCATVRALGESDYVFGDIYGFTNKVRVYPFGRVVRGITLSPSNPVLAVGNSLYLGKTVSPNEGYYEKIEWYSKNKMISDVDNMGQIRGVSPGQTEITAIVDESVRSSVSVNVYEVVSNVEDKSQAESLKEQAGDIIDSIANTVSPDIIATDIGTDQIEKIRDDILEGAERGDEFHTDLSIDEKDYNDYEAEWDSFEESMGVSINSTVSADATDENGYFINGYDVSIEMYHEDNDGDLYHIGNITQPEQEIDFTLELPAHYRWMLGGHYKFYILRLHNGKLKKYLVEINKDGSFKVRSDLFSDFVLVGIKDEESGKDSSSSSSKKDSSPKDKKKETAAKKTDELSGEVSKGKNGNGTIIGVYQSAEDTVSVNLDVTKGKIKKVSLDARTLKKGENKLTLNTKVKLSLYGGTFSVSQNGYDAKTFKKMQKFLKANKKDGSQTLTLKPMNGAKDASYELVLVSEKMILRIDVVDVSLAKKAMKGVTLSKAASFETVSDNSVLEEDVKQQGYCNKEGVVTIATIPATKTGIKGKENESARFLSGVWVIGKEVIKNHDFKVVNLNKKGTARIIVKYNNDGSLSLAKADGSLKGTVKLNYFLNGKVYKAKVKVQ